MPHGWYTEFPQPVLRSRRRQATEAESSCPLTPRVRVERQLPATLRPDVIHSLRRMIGVAGARGPPEIQIPQERAA